MLIEDAIRSAEATLATVTAQEFRGYKYARVSTLTVKRLCKWVIDMGQQVIAMRQKVFELETELDAVKTPGRESTARTDVATPGRESTARTDVATPGRESTARTDVATPGRGGTPGTVKEVR